MLIREKSLYKSKINSEWKCHQYTNYGETTVGGKTGRQQLSPTHTSPKYSRPDIGNPLKGSDFSRCARRDSKAVTLGTSSTSEELVPAFTWCEAKFALPDAGPGWSIPWKLTFEADRDALFYLNRTFIGRYMVLGPQASFYLPQSSLRSQG
jgi:hypothetical protein